MIPILVIRRLVAVLVVIIVVIGVVVLGLVVVFDHSLDSAIAITIGLRCGLILNVDVLKSLKIWAQTVRMRLKVQFLLLVQHVVSVVEVVHILVA